MGSMTEDDKEAEKARVAAQHVFLELCRAERSIETMRDLMKKRGGHAAFRDYVSRLGIRARIDRLVE